MPASYQFSNGFSSRRFLVWWQHLLLLLLLLYLSVFVGDTLAKQADKGDSKKVYNCDIVLDSSVAKNGTIKSPSFPNTYPPRTFCRYDFKGRGKERIQISFNEFNLPTSGDYECGESDSLKIYEFHRLRPELTETLCGDPMPKPIMSDSSRMLIEFKGMKSGMGSRGFKADYSFLENFGISSGNQLPDSACSFQYNSSQSLSGWIHSPNFPGAYPRNLECNYLFYGEHNQKVIIKFTYFDVEGVFPCDENSASDYVELSNFLTVDRKFRRQCGKLQKLEVQSDGRFFRLTFRSNDRLDGTGFTAFYNFEADPTTTEVIPEVKQYSRIQNSALNAGKGRLKVCEKTLFWSVIVVIWFLDFKFYYRSILS